MFFFFFIFIELLDHILVICQVVGENALIGDDYTHIQYVKNNFGTKIYIKLKSTKPHIFY